MPSVLACLVFVLGCAGASSRVEPQAPPVAPPVAEAPRPSSALELVRLLAAIAAGERPGSLEEHVDQAFAERLPSGDDLAALLRGVPEGCTPVLTESGGYAAVAIPPPMDDDPPEEIARIEAIIAELQAATEVAASCRVVEPNEDGDPVEREQMLYAITVRRAEDGRWRAMAWRNFLGEDTSCR